MWPSCSVCAAGGMGSLLALRSAQPHMSPVRARNDTPPAAGTARGTRRLAAPSSSWLTSSVGCGAGASSPKLLFSVRAIMMDGDLSSGDGCGRAFVWFRSDLRLGDNAVVEAVTRSRPTSVVPIYIFDPRDYGQSVWGSQVGAYRARFLVDSVKDLRRGLRAIGSDLLVGVGSPEHLLPLLIAAAANSTSVDSTCMDSTLFWAESTTKHALERDAEIAARIGSRARLRAVWSGTLFDPDLLFPLDRSALPHSLREFRRVADAHADSIPRPLPQPTRGMFPPATGFTYDDLALPEGASLGWDLLPTPEMLGLRAYSMHEFLDGQHLDRYSFLSPFFPLCRTRFCLYISLSPTFFTVMLFAR